MPDFGDVGYDRPGGRYEYQGSVNPNDPSVANGQISPEEWAQYQAKRRRDALLGTLMTLGGMAGAQPLANAIFGIGAGAGAAGGGAGAAGGALPAVEGVAPWAVTPFAAPVTATGAGIGAGAAGAGAGAGVLGGLTARDLAAIGLSGVGTVGGYLSNRNNRNALQPNATTTDPNLQRLLQTMQGRLDKSEPLIDSIFSMANGLLPTQYQKGGGGMG